MQRPNSVNRREGVKERDRQSKQEGIAEYSRSIDDAQTIFPATHLFNTLSHFNVIFSVVVVVFFCAYTYTIPLGSVSLKATIATEAPQKMH